jgi:hypothetical protein
MHFAYRNVLIIVIIALALIVFHSIVVTNMGYGDKLSSPLMQLRMFATLWTATAWLVWDSLGEVNEKQQNIRKVSLIITILLWIPFVFGI